VFLSEHTAPDSPCEGSCVFLSEHTAPEKPERGYQVSLKIGT